LEGNVIRVEGSRVQVRGTLECREKGVKTCKLVTEEVELKECRIVEDSLTWHDQYILSAAVRRVEFQNNAKHGSDFLEETVVEMMLKWGFYGHTADQGLRPVSTRQWVASVWEYPYLLQAWNTVKDSDEPLIELLQLLSQQEQGPLGKGVGGLKPKSSIYLSIRRCTTSSLFPYASHRANIGSWRALMCKSARCSCWTVRRTTVADGEDKFTAFCGCGLWHRFED
jgi:hypothetical protein